MGKVIEVVDTSSFDELVDKVNRYIESDERQAEKLADSPSFRMVWMARKYDDWFLDPIVGFFIPGIGDLISSAATIPALYVAAVKIRSLRLTIAILTAIVTDLLVGLIPFAGDVVDAFYKSSKLASRLIVGYIDDDEVVIREINKRATWGCIGLIIAGFLIYFMYSAVLAAYHWIVGLF